MIRSKIIILTIIIFFNPNVIFPNEIINKKSSFKYKSTNIENTFKYGNNYSSKESINYSNVDSLNCNNKVCNIGATFWISLIPGFFVHGSGHFYIKKYKTGLLLFDFWRYELFFWIYW